MAYFTVSGDEEYNPDEVDEDSPERIVGQMIDLDGNPIGDNFTIASGYQLEDYISLAYNNFNDNFLIVWAEGRSDSLDIDIKGRTIGFDIDGNLVDSPVIDICISSGEHDKPAIIYSAIENKYLVVWQDYRGEDRDIYGRFVNSDGVLEEEFIICNYAEHQISPAVTYNEQEQNFLVTWSDERDSLSIDQSVYGRLVDLNGQLLGEEALIAFEENSYHEPVAVTYNNGSKKSLILYNENYNHVFAQKVSDNLALDGDKIEIGNIDQGLFLLIYLTQVLHLYHLSLQALPLLRERSLSDLFLLRSLLFVYMPLLLGIRKNLNLYFFHAISCQIQVALLLAIHYFLEQILYTLH